MKIIDVGLTLATLVLFIPLSMWGGMERWTGPTDSLPFIMMVIALVFVIFEGVRIENVLTVAFLGALAGAGMFLPSLYFYPDETSTAIAMISVYAALGAMVVIVVRVVKRQRRPVGSLESAPASSEIVSTDSASPPVVKSEDLAKPLEFKSKRQTPSGTYEVYQGSSAKSARNFLASKEVDQNKYYIKVETPEGNWGVDIDGLYLEQLVPFQRNLDKAHCDGSLAGVPSMSSLQYAAKGIADNFIVTVKCGGCGWEWDDGVRFKHANVVRCPDCNTLNKVDSKPHIIEVGGALVFRLEI